MKSDRFRVALSASFKNAEGGMTYPSFDLAPLGDAEDLEFEFLSPGTPVRADELEDFDALILLSENFVSESIPKSSRLGIVARFGVGYDSVDVDACTQNDIAVCITPDGVRRPVAISILTMMLALTGKLVIKDRLARLGPAGFAARSDHMGAGLVGRTLGSIGIGNIGAEMFRLAKPFDMRFMAFDPYADPKVAAELGIELVELQVLFEQSDVLAINCPLTDETHHLVNEERLASMKHTSFLINTARGPIIDQKALTAALQSGQIAGAGLDVFETEPPDQNDPILALDNVIVTPHALCWTDQCFAGIGASDVAAVLEIQKGQIPNGLVNPKVLDRAGFKDKLQKYSIRN